MAYSKGRAGTAWNLLRARVFAEETHCWICGKWVDQELPRTHPMSRTVDHVIELWQQGAPTDRANCRLSHRRCNTSKSNRTRAKGRPRASFTVNTTAL